MRKLKAKRMLSASLAVALLMSLASLLPALPAAQAVFAADYGPISFSTSYPGSIDSGSEQNTYKIELTEPGRLFVSVTPNVNDGVNYLNVHWLDGSGSTIKSPSGTSSGSLPYNDYMDLEAGTYQIRTSKYSSHAGAYFLKADFTAANNNEEEPNNTIAAAQLLSSGQTVKGFISYQDDIDIYKYVLANPLKLTVNITRDVSIGTRQANVYWLDANGATIHSATGANGSIPYSHSMDLEAGTYYIRVSKQSGSDTGTYFLTIQESAQPSKYTVTVSANNASYGTASANPAQAAQGEAVSLTATARSGYVFSSWEVVSGTATISNLYSQAATLTMPGGNVSVRANFSAGNSNTGQAGTSQGASSWAVAGIDEAIKLGIIPSELLKSYQTNITRAEFCKTAVRMLMVKCATADNEDVFIRKYNINLNENPFTDTRDRYIKMAYKLGIVNGVGNNRFAPNSTITRQEAAAMLSRAAGVFDFTAHNGQPIRFADEGAIASWAKSPVNFVSANGVMDGTGNNMFSPNGNYTREQAILTMLRLFKAFPRDYYPI